MLALKLIPVFWILVLGSNLLAKRFAPDIMSWYLPYSIGIGAAFTMHALYLAGLYRG